MVKLMLFFCSCCEQWWDNFSDWWKSYLLDYRALRTRQLICPRTPRNIDLFQNWQQTCQNNLVEADSSVTHDGWQLYHKMRLGGREYWSAVRCMLLTRSCHLMCSIKLWHDAMITRMKTVPSFSLCSFWVYFTERRVSGEELDE